MGMSACFIRNSKKRAAPIMELPVQLQRLPRYIKPRQRFFILHRYCFLENEPLTMAEACRVFSLSETRAKEREAKAFESIRVEYEKNYKTKVEGLLFWQRFLREDEGIYIPFVPPGVRRNLPFPSTPDEKALVE